MSGQLQAKAIECLTIAAMHVGSPERVRAIEQASKRWSWRGLGIKMQELADRGYIEPLLSGTAVGDITHKGRAALKQARARA